MTDPATLAATLRRLAYRLERDASISPAERAEMEAAGRILDFIAAHAEALRLLVSQIRAHGAPLPAATAADLADHPAVAAVLEAFPGAVLADVRPIAESQEPPS